MSDSLQRVIVALTRAGCDPRSVGPDSYESCCPCHQGRRRNLSIGIGDTGLVVIHCHHVGESGKSCSASDVLAAIGLSFADVMTDGQPSRQAKQKRQPRSYPARDAAIAVIARMTGHRYIRCWDYPASVDGFAWSVVRLDGPDGAKTYRPIHQRPEGWRIGDPPGILPLYRSGNVASASYLIVTEGEKAADALPPRDVWGAVSPAHGAQSPHRSDWSICSGRHVVIWPDNDEAGRGYVVRVRECLSRLTPSPASVRVIDPAQLGLTGAGDDAADYSGCWDRVEMVIRQTTPIGATVTPPEPARPLELQRTRSGDPWPNLHNGGLILQSLEPKIWYDSFYDRIFTNDGHEVRPWIDTDTVSLTAAIQRDLVPNMAKGTIADAVACYARQHARDEPLDWLRSLQWDGQPRIERFFVERFGVAATEYVLAASRNFWISLAARIVRPGCQVDTMIVLEGAQGAGKSSAMRAIGEPWFAETSTSPTNKDFYLCLLGKVVVEIAELDSFSRADVNAVKQVISNPSDYYRSPYDRDARDHPRRCVFVGTTNRTDWHRDETGGRRFWPIRVGGEIDVAGISRDRDQLYAEAAARLAAGETWHVMPSVQTRAEQAARLQEDAWERPIAEWVSRRPSVYMADVLTEALKLETGRHDMAATKRAGAILRRLGWDSATTRHAGKVVRQWMPPPEPDDVTGVTACNGSAF